MSRRFVFALQPVLAQRERAEAEKQRVLAQRQRVLNDAKASLAALHNEFREYSGALRDKHRSFTTEELRLYYAHLEFLDRAIAAAEETAATAQHAFDRARDELLAASKERKAIEKLKEKRHASHVAEENALEQRELDDGNARRFGRAQLEHGSSL
ncbi:MAG: flagellar export protein FliJ [Candidatus Eremiobacteraeota bacterium]|nr:flagellar export protein FliJ [Candidatus Eremiobacteraeota bacterium]